MGVGIKPVHRMVHVSLATARGRSHVSRIRDSIAATLSKSSETIKPPSSGYQFRVVSLCCDRRHPDTRSEIYVPSNTQHIFNQTMHHDLDTVVKGSSGVC